MIFAKKPLPFIYSDLFIFIAIMVMVFLAIFCFVLIPLFYLRKTPNKKAKLLLNVEGNAIINDELAPLFTSISVKDCIITFKRAKGIEKVRVAITFSSFGLFQKTLVYDLDFSSGEELRVAFPNHYRKIINLVTVDEKNFTSEGKPILELSRSHLWVFSIISGIATGGSIFLVVIILSTHLRKVDPSFGVFYMFAAIGLVLIPAIYFGTRLVELIIRKVGNK